MHVGGYHGGGGCCCCGGGGGFPRRFYTRQERIAHMEEYLDGLKAELAAVERELARTKEKDGDEVSGDCCCGH